MTEPLVRYIVDCSKFAAIKALVSGQQTGNKDPVNIRVPGY